MKTVIAKPPPIVLTPEHQARVRRSLDLLQAAQTLIDEAAQALCPAAGLGDEWSGLTTPYEAVKRAWHRIERRRAVLQSRALVPR